MLPPPSDGRSARVRWTQPGGTRRSGSRQPGAAGPAADRPGAAAAPYQHGRTRASSSSGSPFTSSARTASSRRRRHRRAHRSRARRDHVLRSGAARHGAAQPDEPLAPAAAERRRPRHGGAQRHDEVRRRPRPSGRYPRRHGRPQRRHAAREPRPFRRSPIAMPGPRSVDAHVEATIDLLERAGRFALPNTGWGDIDSAARRRVRRAARARGGRDGTMVRAPGLRRCAAGPRRRAAEHRVRRGAYPHAAACRPRADGRRSVTRADRCHGVPRRDRRGCEQRLPPSLGAISARRLGDDAARGRSPRPTRCCRSTPFDTEHVRHGRGWTHAVADLFKHLLLRLGALRRRRSTSGARQQRRCSADHDAAHRRGAARRGADRRGACAARRRRAVHTRVPRLGASQGTEWAAAMAWCRTGNLTAHLSPDA